MARKNENTIFALKVSGVERVVDAKLEKDSKQENK
jgi:hypothetical protein